MSVVKPVNCAYNGQDEKCLLKDTCHNFRKRIVKFSSVVVHTYNPRTWESESGGSWFEARLHCTARFYPQTEKNTTKCWYSSEETTH